MQTSINDYKSLGLLAVLILILGLAFVVIKWPQGKHLTFSQHVAFQKQSIIYYSLLFCVALPPLLLFFIGWFTPTFHLSTWFNVFLIISCITQIACTLIPEVGGWKTKYHRALAGASGFCLIPALLFIVLSNQINSSSRILAGLGIITMFYIIIMVSKNGGKHSHFLILQSAYYAVFFIPVLVAAYL